MDGNRNYFLRSVDFIVLFAIIIVGEESPQYDLGYSPLPDMRFINGRDEICLPPPDVMRATNGRVSNLKTLLRSSQWGFVV